MANQTLAPYKGHPAAEVQAFEHGSDPDTMTPEGVWEATVTAEDLSGEHATRTILLTFGGTEDDGDYETVFTLNGVAVATVTTTRAAGDPDDNEALAEQHALDIEAESALDEYRADVFADGVVASVAFLPGIAMTAASTAPAGATLDESYQVGINLNDLQPNEAFPAYALRGESPTLRVLEAFSAGSTATLEDEGVASSTVLSAVTIDALGWVGDTGTDLGDAHKTESDWEPYLTVATTTALPTTGELKVQVTHSPLPE